MLAYKTSMLITSAYYLHNCHFSDKLRPPACLLFTLATNRLEMPSVTRQLVNTQVFRSPPRLLSTHFSHFQNFQEQYNIMYPQIAHAIMQEIGGFLGNDSVWITCASGAQGEVPDLVLSCSEDSLGSKLPIFIASSHPVSMLKNRDFLAPLLLELITTLRNEVSDARVFSVFAPDQVTVTFAELWTSETGIAREFHPYYSATYARCTKKTFKNRQFTILGDATYEMRLAVESDVKSVAKLCYDFASTSVRLNFCSELARCSRLLLRNPLLSPPKGPTRKQKC